ncbi:histidine kinase [Cohnella kolymensis]|uniref:Histidine kinase n=1 Tax=Cohnella kolymensis TaxID=1590652 RepID=A0ABR5A986_9BACL|nr:GGDEF domain-containing protein [Cohnella kolymensis]KIL37604.1 histidine kinase [Cohnella kolymensis]
MERLEDIGVARWNRKLLNMYWFCILVTTVGEIGNLFLSESSYQQFIIYSLLAPLSVLLALMGVSEFFYRKINSSSPEITILTGILLTGVIVYAHADIDSILGVYFLPLLVSVFYFKKSYVYKVSFMNLASLIIMYLIQPELRLETTAMELFTTILVVGVAGPYIAAQIMDRGVDILQNLKHDALTGLSNHMTFHDHLQQWYERGRRRKEPVMLAVMDFDDFKCINDVYGHRAGDMVLRGAADILSSYMGGEDIAARYGGEEFALLLTGRTEREAYMLCEEIRTAISASEHPELKGRTVTVSIGLTGLEPGMDKESWFRQADKLLYQAKRLGKNRTETKFNGSAAS